MGMTSEAIELQRTGTQLIKYARIVNEFASSALIESSALVSTYMHDGRAHIRRVFTYEDYSSSETAPSKRSPLPLFEFPRKAFYVK